MKISVVGAGKMGLPLACQMADMGGLVFACDIRQETVATINSGKVPFDEPGIPELLERNVANSRLRATTDTVGAVKESDAVIIIVPAVLTEDNHADLRALEAVTRDVIKGMHDGLLVSYETTLPVGTTRRHFLPMLEQSGKKCGKDFFLVFSPERVKSQLVLAHLTEAPKVVGGIDPLSAEKGSEMYRQFLGAPVINVGTVEAAEMVKLAGMIYRDVTIALANQLARYADKVGVDLPSIIPAINTDGEANLLYPGIGVGGHCAPVYPYFVIHHARELGIPVTLSEIGRETNDGQSLYLINRLEELIGGLKGLNVLILGLGFRPEVKEQICSTAFLLKPALIAKGANVTIHDPLYTDEEIAVHGFKAGGYEEGKAPDVIILNTSHKPYYTLDFADLANRGLKAVIDGRNIWNPEQVRSSGIAYIGVGKP